jgi:hypothetical protein
MKFLYRRAQRDANRKFAKGIARTSAVSGGGTDAGAETALKKRRRRALRLSGVLLVIVLGTIFSKSPPSAPESAVDVFQRSWESLALGLERTLQNNTPFKDATFLHTHNSYNSSKYTTAVSYLDPNHSETIYDQLRMGVRAIEFDVHWYFSMEGWPWEWGNRPLLCHGQNNHLGCSSYDRHLSKGMSEVNSWIRSNRHEVIILYMEEHLDGHYNDALNVIKASVGDLIYRPELVRAGTTCEDVPMNLSRQQVLNAGKNIILWTSGCAGGEWGRWVFRKNNNVPESNISQFTGYPGCGNFDRNTYATKMIRYYEDRTNLTAWFGGGSGQTTPANMAEMMKCGVNLPGTDKLTATDGRLAAAVWSWHPGEPNDYAGNEDCAHQWGNGRWNDNNCNVSYRYACKGGSGNWYVTNAAGPWQNGFHYCASETGGSHAYAVPVNGYENQKLLEVKQAKGQSDVWLNYSDRAREGAWSP